MATLGGSLSIENLLIEKMAKLNCSAAFISLVSGYSQTKLSQALSGLRPLPSQDALGLLQQVRRMEKLIEQVAPIPVSFKNPTAIRELMDAMDAGRVRVVVDPLVNQ